MEKFHKQKYSEINDKINSFNMKQYADFIILLEQSYSQSELIEIYNYILANQKNSEILIYTLKQIDKMKNEKFFDSLVDLLLLKETFTNLSGDKNVNMVRCQAAKAISNFKLQKGVYPLLYCLNNKKENYKLRLICAEALGKIGDKYAVMPLIELINDRDEKSIYVQESVVSALGMLGDIRALEPLLNILEKQNEIWNKFTFLKEKIIEVLARFNPNGERVIKVLKNSLQDESPYVRISAINTLSTMDNTNEVVKLVEGMINDENEEVVEASIDALYQLCDVEYMNKIIREDKYSKKAKEFAKQIIKEEYTDEI